MAQVVFNVRQVLAGIDLTGMRKVEETNEPSRS